MTEPCIDQCRTEYIYFVSFMTTRAGNVKITFDHPVTTWADIMMMEKMIRERLPKPEEVVVTNYQLLSENNMSENIECVIELLELLGEEMLTRAKEHRYRTEWAVSDEIYEYVDKTRSIINLLKGNPEPDLK